MALSEAEAERIGAAAEAILERTGIAMPEAPEALERWRAAGARVTGDRVRLPAGLARSLCATAPRRFVQAAPNGGRALEIGGAAAVAMPLHGASFLREPGGLRRYATLDDLRDFIAEMQLSPAIAHAGGAICEPTDIPVELRHLAVLRAQLELTDKPLMGTAGAPERAREILELTGGGAEALRLLTPVTVNSPLVLDRVMSEALEIHAAAGQAVLISSFLIMGVSAPRSVAGALALALAELMAVTAYAQLVRPGTPVVAGAFVAPVDPQSGAVRHAAPAALAAVEGIAGLCRRLGLPCRAGGALTDAEIHDARADAESAAGVMVARAADVDVMLHAAGGLEGGLVADLGKFRADAARLAQIRAGAAASEELLRAQEEIAEAGPGGIFLMQESEAAAGPSPEALAGPTPQSAEIIAEIDRRIEAGMRAL